MYKLTKGHLSVIRADEAGAQEAVEEGFALEGRCDENGVVTDANVTLEKKAPKKAPKKGEEDKED